MNEKIDLVPNGENVDVTNENKVEYIKLYANSLLTRNIRK